jgi:type II secretory pathway component PulK
LEDIFTTLGGPVNVNTASKEVLMAIPGVNETIADQIIQNRNEAPFIDVGETINAGANPQAIRQYCDVHSRTFEVQVIAEVGGTRRTFYAIVGRAGPKNFQILSFYWK